MARRINGELNSAGDSAASLESDGSIKAMRRSIFKSLAVVLLIVAVAWAAFGAATLKNSSATFAGPEFHSRDTGSSATVHVDLARYLEDRGFKKTSSPSEMDSWAGVRSEGSGREWFSKKDSKRRATWVAVDVDERTVRTSVKWAAYGSDKTRRVTENGAYELALELDGWFRARTQVNALPERLMDEKRDWFTEQIAQAANP